MKLPSLSILAVFVIFSLRIDASETVQLIEDYTAKIDGGEIGLKSGQTIKIIKVVENQITTDIAGSKISIPIDKTNFEGLNTRYPLDSRHTSTKPQSTETTDQFRSDYLKPDGFEIKLIKLAKEYNLSKTPETVIDSLDGHYTTFSHYELSQTLGHFIDNESDTSGQFFDFNIKFLPSTADGKSDEDKGEDCIEKNEISALFRVGIFKIKQRRRHWENKFDDQGKYVGTYTAGFDYDSYEINAIDIPWMMYIQEMSRRGETSAITNNLQAGITKDMGVSPSGNIKATFITTGDSLGGTYNYEMINRPDFKFYDTIFKTILYDRIDQSRINYISNKLSQKNDLEKDQKLKIDKSRADSILK